MKVEFSMDGIRDMEYLYTWEGTSTDESGVVRIGPHYHGAEYISTIAEDVFKGLTFCADYQPSRESIDERYSFNLLSISERMYTITFFLGTYGSTIAHLEITIHAPDTEEYDFQLEELKIALKERLLLDWQACTWICDDQSVKLCKESYESTFVLENKLRAFASKVLIHFLGVHWLNKAGLEKKAESVGELKKQFVQRVPEFDNINTDFLSMTLETLASVMFEGVIYKDDVILSRKDYDDIQQLGAKDVHASALANYIKKRRSVETKIWDDLFVPLIESPDDFKLATTAFIGDRNHVAHSKLLSWNAYQVMLKNFHTMDDMLVSANEKFDVEEAPDEVVASWLMETDDETNHREYYRSRLAGETGMEILDEDDIANKFDESLHDLFTAVWQRYRFDVSVEMSDFSPTPDGIKVFTVSSVAVADGSARIDVKAEYSIDDDLGEDSTCYLTAVNGAGKELFQAEIHFHNGNGAEGENGLMEVNDNTEYDQSELDAFVNELYAAIDEMNPYPAKLEALAYENKGAVSFVGDFPCQQCGKFGVSINEEFLPVGHCCYCGYEHELATCERCGELFSADSIVNGLCPSCLEYIERQ